MDELEVYDLLTYYYRSPVPQRAVDALRWYVTTPDVEDPLSYVPACYFFARLAQEHPSLIGKYETVLQDAPQEGKHVVASILREVRTVPPGPTNALDRETWTPTGNDLLWAEFVLTGSREPIVRLIDHLERLDIIRARLQAWLKSPITRFFAARWYREHTCEKLRLSAGIVCDPRRKKIETQGDLDCLCMMQGLYLASAAQTTEVRDALPFDLSDSDLELIGVKASAKWSLASNANRHPLVFATCERELLLREGTVKTALQEIVDEARRNQADYAEAMKLRQEADEGSAAAQCKLGTMYEDGRGVHQDDRLALTWYRKSAEQGCPEAYY
jgi:hypothetical protein